MADPNVITAMLEESRKSTFDNRFHTSREFSNHYFDTFERVRAEPLSYFAMTAEQRETLRDVADHLDEEITTMALGISAIGEILQAAADNESAGISLDSLRQLGWFLHFTGVEMNEHINNLSMANDRLRHCRIKDTKGEG